MLTYCVRDIKGESVTLRHPLKVIWTASETAPADGLHTVFAVEGTVPLLHSIEVRDGEKRVFFGYVDEQTEELLPGGKTLRIAARSIAALLLDNEARPQIYCSPSMPLLMKRHFAPLGFTEFQGTEKAFSGQLVVEKGMSEWSVLTGFCRFLDGVTPKVDPYGRIDITGQASEEEWLLSPDRFLSYRRSLKNNVLLSEVIARTYARGDYEMPLKNETAGRVGVRRRRYVNAIDNKMRTVLTARELIRKSCSAYDSICLTVQGWLACRPGDVLRINGELRRYRIRETEYCLDSSGERTKIEAEVELS